MTQHRYKSGFERTLAAQLENAGVTFKYESLVLPYVVEHNYHPDFVITTLSGKTIIIEAKGRFMPGNQGKMRLVKRHHPELDIRFIFMNADLPLRKGSKTTHGDWATKHGFQWAEGKVPLEWISS